MGENKVTDMEQARRRARRERLRRSDPAPHSAEPVKFAWSDTLAMIIAAYQVLLPILLVIVGVLVGFYFLFTWFFS